MNNQGFIALTIVLILSVVLLLLAHAMSTSGYFQSSNSLDFRFKELSYFAALSCLDRARYELSKDFDYPGDVTLPIGIYTCTINPITFEGNNTVIRTWASTENSTTKLKMVLDIYLAPLSFEEE